MPAYVVAEIEVTDAAEFERYRPLAAASIARFGGRYVVRGGNADLLEGAPAPSRVVILEFDDATAAQRWYQSEEYQTALKIRLASSRGRVFLVEGAA
ncbi:MAG: DUF1330 domain-containing protein [Alphaproteobacteria bacterium]|nr:DUF1330 domain-containing protein [Alphaproteobacteria bacterium]